MRWGAEVEGPLLPFLLFFFPSYWDVCVCVCWVCVCVLGVCVCVCVTV